jgi:hypothetical protein
LAYILSFPLTTITSNPPITTAEALEAIKTELKRRSVIENRAAAKTWEEIRTKLRRRFGSFRSEEANASSDATAPSEASQEGTETGDDGEYPFSPL